MGNTSATATMTAAAPAAGQRSRPSGRGAAGETLPRRPGRARPGDGSASATVIATVITTSSSDRTAAGAVGLER